MEKTWAQDMADDNQVLTQSTVFKDRVFLSNSMERSTVCSLLGNQISKDDFVTSPDIESENGILVRDLVQFLDEDGHHEIHPVYKRFLRNVSKPTSARGLLQVTNFLPLGYLADKSSI